MNSRVISIFSKIIKIGILLGIIFSLHIPVASYNSEKSTVDLPPGKITFTSRIDGNLEIYAMNSDGTKVKRLTYYSGNDHSSAFSPDGKYIAFIRNDRQLRIMQTEYGDPDNNTSELIFDGSYGMSVPRWSPDGIEIVYRSNTGNNQEIYKIKVDNSEPPQQLTDNSYWEGYPDYHPDGNKIAFVRKDSGTEEAFIYLMDTDGSNQEPLLDTNEQKVRGQQIRWSPLGNQILSYQYIQAENKYQTAVIDVSLDTNSKYVATNQNVLPKGGGGNGWSPDASIVAYSSGRTIYVINSDGSGDPVSISPYPGYDAFQDWVDLKPWTLMYYIAGDNDLGYPYDTYMPIFNQLESVANNKYVNILILWDRYGDNEVYYYEIQENINKWKKEELNTGDPQTLSDFIQWGISNYPAERYAIIMDDHGTGLGGAMIDDTSEEDILTIPEIQTGLKMALGSGDTIDLLVMNACLMAMIEDAYQFRDYINYYAASENLQWVYESGYSSTIKHIKENTSTKELTEFFVDEYAIDIHKTGVNYTMSGAEIDKLAELVSATNDLAFLLNENMDTNADTLTSVLNNVQRFNNKTKFPDGTPDEIDLLDTYIDLHHFAELVAENFSNTDIQIAAQGVMDAVEAYVFINRFRPHVSEVDNSNGVSIFFPHNRSSFYNQANYDFAAGAEWNNPTSRPLNRVNSTVEWGAMLVSYFETTKPDGPDDPSPPEVRTKPIVKFYGLPIIYR